MIYQSVKQLLVHCKASDNKTRLVIKYLLITFVKLRILYCSWLDNEAQTIVYPDCSFISTLFVACAGYVICLSTVLRENLLLSCCVLKHF